MAINTITLTLLFVSGPESFSANWFREILNQIMQNTPHSWPENTLNCFPQNLRDYFQQNVIQRDDKVDLKRRVDTEYKKWKSKFVLIDLLHIPNMILKLCV